MRRFKYGQCHIKESRRLVLPRTCRFLIQVFFLVQKLDCQAMYFDIDKESDHVPGEERVLVPVCMYATEHCCVDISAAMFSVWLTASQQIAYC
jgi:hypothetical protein